MTASRWRNWIGPVQRSSDQATESLLARWLATFDRPPVAGSWLPQGLHFCLCPPDAPTRELGEDGHPDRSREGGSFLPPVPLERRMWAGSRITFHAPLEREAAVTRTSRILNITEKSGRSGLLVFAEIEHVTESGAAVRVHEVQTLVFRPAAPRDAPLAPPPPPTAEPFAPEGWTRHRTLVPDERLLFRYSALTFNTHRIHYDAPYAREVERYRGLVVHGPLLASLLLQLAADHCGDNALSEFTFQARSPAICGDALHLALADEGAILTLRAVAQDGRVVVDASARRAQGKG
ncbi:hypothetical protein EYB45_02090 [Erythrobacteraceae bacterium CFH 75059]|uniref:FAS1-like dehydratase domain-containing protein n=1 Tax=Qipengyuania thermophila TaxID=2509361 RepID=UPI00101EFF09|nr:MaoC family dehydratase N-terminal domain-containing protein [Qipengyuania thermophila]TCD06529.1 hypothetical protein EYB45_02090 [Erythrobacteraceae bacterium CFH 75059]